MASKKHTVYHISLIITIIVTVCRSIVDVEALDGGVVVTGSGVLWERTGRRHTEVTRMQNYTDSLCQTQVAH